MAASSVKLNDATTGEGVSGLKIIGGATKLFLSEIYVELLLLLPLEVPDLSFEGNGMGGKLCFRIVDASGFPGIVDVFTPIISGPRKKAPL